ncbi:hypothetical protein [Stenotrophomonas sp. B1-1]|uniref:hypothetical protein n=1 Tax=Stenotrophomonas sp. B1-1 TaxID=2710648 RepID=UPI0013DC06C0|nr:hypothetical protein [Stenotrophomonas sp. B1-1]
MSTISRAFPSTAVAALIGRAWTRLVSPIATGATQQHAQATRHGRCIGRLHGLWHRNHLAPHLALFGLGTPGDLYLREARGLASQLNRRLHILYAGDHGAGLGRPLELLHSGLAEQVTLLAASHRCARQLRVAAEALGMADDFFIVTPEQPHSSKHAHDLVVLDQWRPAHMDAPTLCSLLDRVLSEQGMIAWTGSIGCRQGTWPAIEQQICSQLDALGMQDPRPARAARASPDPACQPADLVAALGKHFQFELFHTYGGAVVSYVETPLATTLAAHEDTEVLLASIDRYDRQCLQERMYPPTRVLATLRRSVHARMRQHVPLSPREFVAMVAQHRLT